MDELTKGTKYRVTVPLTFEGEYSHIEEQNGVDYACFKTPGVNRFGETFRKVPVEVVLSTREVE